MDVATATVSLNSNANTNISAAKPSDPDTETPTRIIQHAKPLSFTNGFLKRHHQHHHHVAALPAVVTYKECLKNHAASMGGHALDGCGEFMPSPAATPSDPTSFKCAACGCHRNFHRRDDPEDSPPPLPPPAATMEYQPHHRHHPPPPPPNRSPNSASPPPISSSYYPSAPHMLLALSGGVSGLNDHPAVTNLPGGGGGSSTRKRFRTKFSQAQKERMFEFAEQVGWKMQKRDEDLVQEFCNEVGVDKGVLKVWMHNNKNTFGKKDANGGDGAARSSNGTPADNNGNVHSNGENTNHHHHHNHHHQQFGDDNVVHVVNNGSSSSS